MKRSPVLILSTFLFAAAFALAGAGCATLAKEAAIGAAEDPYRKAMLAGKISHADYLRETEAIRRAANGSKDN